MRMGQGVRTGLGHGGITCVLQTQFSSSISDEPIMLFFLCIYVKMSTIVGILTFMSRKNFMLS